MTKKESIQVFVISTIVTIGAMTLALGKPNYGKRCGYDKNKCENVKSDNPHHHRNKGAEKPNSTQYRNEQGS